MVEPTLRSRPEGDDEALLYVLGLAAGVGAGVLCASLVHDPLLSSALGFVGMCAGMFPFARRTWAADLSVWNYWTGVILGTAVAMALQLQAR